jgi:hypothetical protein
VVCSYLSHNTKVSAVEFASLVENLKLDFCTNLYYDVTWAHSRKRCAKSVDISCKALEEHLGCHPAHSRRVTHLLHKLN